MRPTPPAARRVSLLVAALGVAFAGAVPASAAPAAVQPAHDRNHSPRPHTVATGLDNPRQLSVGADGSVYVAESGRGGTDCRTIEETRLCFGLTGGVTRLSHGRQARVISALPSVITSEGASGPADVVVHGRQVAVLLGLGGDAQDRATFGPAAARLGTLLTGRLGGRLRIAADLTAYEGDNDPDKGGADSNPVSLLRRGHAYVVADAGGNDLVGVRPGSKPSTVAVFPARQVPAPPFLGLPPGAMVPMEAVPTGVTVGPDGAYYVSQLTGFPFPAGGSNIWRVVPGKTPTVYASGLTNVTDLAWAGGRLYAVQLADGGLLSVPEGKLPVGSLRRVVRGASTHPVVAGNLTAPYGVAVRGRTAYVTTCSVCVGGGEVQAIPLR